MAQTNEAPQHPHYGPPIPPPGLITKDRIHDGVPTKLPPGMRFTGEVESVDHRSIAHDASIGFGMKRAYSAGPFPFASTSFKQSAAPSKYAHYFWRDALYADLLIHNTPWPARIGQPNLRWDFIKVAYRDQGLADVPNKVAPWANDGQRKGRTPHEKWGENWQTDEVAQQLNREHGWQIPTYYGAVDTSALLAMVTALAIEEDSTQVLDRVMQKNNEGLERNTTVLQAYLDGLKYMIDECRITAENPEGIFETAPMSNHTNGDWDDSPQGMRTKEGNVAKGKVAHTQLQMYVRSALMGLDDVRAAAANAVAAGQLNPAKFRQFNQVLNDNGFGDKGALTQKARQTADRLGEALFEHFLVTDDPEFGTYFAMGLDRDPDSGELTKLDALGAKPALMTLVKPSHLPAGAAEIAFRQVLDPGNEMISPTGISNMSRLDKLFHPEIYHDAEWMHITALIQYAARQHGLHAVANELAELNLVNFVDPWVVGSNELLAATTESRPVPIQRKVSAVVEDRQPTFHFHAVSNGQVAQLWAHNGLALANYESALAWSGQLPNRTSDPKWKAFEADMVERIEQAQGFLTFALHNADRSLEDFWEPRTQRWTESHIDAAGVSYEREFSATPATAVLLYGQRMPGQKSLNHDDTSISF